MSKLAAALLFAVIPLLACAQAIEGFWQDTERRILYSKDAPPGYVYGVWTALDQKQTYPSAKQILKSSGGIQVIELLYDDEEAISVGRVSSDSIDFTRTSTWSKCAVRHQCSLDGADRMLCALETSCNEQVVWRGEERYARRSSCEQVEVRRAQGIPHRCR